MNELKLFESQYIRSVWNPDEEQWYYSVIDVVAALTDSANPTDYLKKIYLAKSMAFLTDMQKIFGILKVYISMEAIYERTQTI